MSKFVGQKLSSECDSIWASQDIPTIMELQGSLWCTQQPAKRPFTESNEFNPHSQTLLL
jgi:hypothetical protein